MKSILLHFDFHFHFNSFDRFIRFAVHKIFSYDGKKIVFASNRNNGDTRDTNVFIADWVE
ncbi:MAG: hypothetical protein ACPGVB_05545 [Chitinophagales bacterium]